MGARASARQRTDSDGDRIGVNVEAGRPSHCEPHPACIEAKLEAGLSAQRIYQDLVTEAAFSGSYQSVKRFVRQVRRQQPQRVWRIEVEPGEEVQIDFGTGAPVIDADGRRRRPWVLRVILSFSPKLSSFCRHYGCALPPCLPRTPEHKGKTENEIRHLKGNALRGRTFSSLSGENEFLGHWEKTVADVLIHGTTRKQVATLFAQEQKALLPLPPDLFPCFQEGRRTVHRDSYVEVDKAYYTVPPEYIGTGAAPEGKRPDLGVGRSPARLG